jgi:hypothetical protein
LKHSFETSFETSFENSFEKSFKRHLTARLYQSLTPAAMEKLSVEALARAAEKARALHDDRLHKLAALQLQKDRFAAQQVEQGLTMRSSELRMGSDDFAALAEMRRSPAFARAAVRQLRDRAMRAPCVQKT